MEKHVPPIRYAILFPGRTGSTYLVDHMDNHPQICAKYEVLRRFKSSWDEQHSWLENLITHKRENSIQAVGFKTKLIDVAEPEKFAEYLIEKQFKIIYQYRSNKLKFLVSVIRAKMLREKYGQSNVAKESQTLGATEIPADLFEKELKRISSVERLEKYVRNLKLPTLDIGYEQLLEDETGTLARLWEFLGIDMIETSGVTKKNTPQDLRQAVTNLDELLDKFPEMKKHANEP